MKFTLRGASGVAILAGLASGLPGWAQETPQTVLTTQVSGPQAAKPVAVDQTPAPLAGPQAAPAADRVVVTGSLIKGTPENAALPVEVFTHEEMDKRGDPTALEFVKSLSISGPTSGEAYYFSGAALTGSVNVNLRGIGAGRTLTLMNGRRMSQNTSNIPSAAIARTEILKDGAAATYGADATGGVVNFITRDSFVGFEAKAQYKAIDGSNGDYGVSMLGGFGKGDTNFLWSAEWEHRSRLNTLNRSFSSQPYAINPAPYSTFTNLAGYVPRANPVGPPPVGPVANGATSPNLEFGAPTGGIISDYTQSSCEAVGGVYVSSFQCAYGYASYYNLVEKNDIYRLYAQLNSRISDHMDIHVEASFGEVMSPQVFGSPAQPNIRGAALASGSTYPYDVPLTNPYAAQWVTTHPVPVGTTNLTPVLYRAFAHGGNDTFGLGNGFGVPSRIENDVWRVSGELKGDLGSIFKGGLGETNYSLAGTYNQFMAKSDAADIMAFRLQEALNGFGGPNCSAADLDPTRNGTQNAAAAGKSGCLYWNPFSSNFAGQPNLGLANPSYIAGANNPKDLERWLFDPRAYQSTTNNLTIDGVLSGKTPIKLWGGPIAWGLGGQWRKTEFRENVTSQFYNGMTPCKWPLGLGSQAPLAPSNPGYNGCTPDSPGPFVFFGTQIPQSLVQNQVSEFVELDVPVLKTLNFQLAARHEAFSGNLSATVYKASGKWDVWGPISIRGSYGTNYAAPPAGLVPGQVNNGVNSYSINGGLWLGTQTQTQTNVTPETAKSQDLGLIWASRGFTKDSDFRFIVDYFDIQTEKQIGLLASVNDIAATVFTGPIIAGFRTANCSAALIARVTFNGGVCVQGTTDASNFSSIRTDFGNGPGQHTAGYDIQADYSFPLLMGDMTLSATATKLVLFRVGAKTLDGFALDTGSNNLGRLNFATIANADPEWRGNASANYKLGQHNVRLTANYISGVVDQRGCIAPTGRQAGTLLPFNTTCFGVNGSDWFTIDFNYLFDITPDMRLSFSVANLTDKNPPSAREELGYDPRIGNPLGRTFEIGLKKTF